MMRDVDRNLYEKADDLERIWAEFDIHNEDRKKPAPSVDAFMECKRAFLAAVRARREAPPESNPCKEVLEDMKVALRMPGTGSYVDYARELRDEQDALKARAESAEAVVRDDVKFLFALLPRSWLDDIPGRLHPTMYFTGRFEGDMDIQAQLKAIARKHGLEVE